MSVSPPRIAITGASGLIGSAFGKKLAAGGGVVHPMVRRSANPGEIHWNPVTQTCDKASLENLSAVVHLAGENIASHRWTPDFKRRFRDSRVLGTRFLCETLARLERPPSVLLSASAVGYYGNRGVSILTEESAPGQGFLAEVCQEWEAATEPARHAGIRVVLLRIGVVLDTQGGALPRMLLPFRLGLGGRIGSGDQMMSWIALDDLLSVLEFALHAPALRGPVNAAAPNAVNNREFVRVLARVLRRPAFFPLPSFAVRLFFGEMGEALLLEGCCVSPRKLIEAGFPFRYPDLESALRGLLTEKNK